MFYTQLTFDISYEIKLKWINIDSEAIYDEQFRRLDADIYDLW